MKQNKLKNNKKYRCEVCYKLHRISRKFKGKELCFVCYTKSVNTISLINPTRKIRYRSVMLNAALNKAEYDLFLKNKGNISMSAFVRKLFFIGLKHYKNDEVNNDN